MCVHDVPNLYMLDSVTRSNLQSVNLFVFSVFTVHTFIFSTSFSSQPAFRLRHLLAELAVSQCDRFMFADFYAGCLFPHPSVANFNGVVFSSNLFKAVSSHHLPSVYIETSTIVHTQLVLNIRKQVVSFILFQFIFF